MQTKRFLKERERKKITIYLFESHCQKYYLGQEICVDET